jgi:tetratricopeptide (TPR) repeat protein
VAVGLLLLLASPRPATGQIGDPKAAFSQSLARFGVALDGTFGDEGRAVRSALDAMARGLGEWDDTLHALEKAAATELPRADPALAARMHVALGAGYLDRSRVTDALREFEAASRLDPSRAEVFAFLGLAHVQLTREYERAVASFQRAAALDPANPIRAYTLGRALSKNGKATEARQAFQAVRRLWNESVGAHPTTPLDTPFIRLGLVQERSDAEPFFPPVLYAEGFALLQRGEFAKAVEAFAREATRDPLVTNAVDPREAMGLAAAAFRDGTMDAAVRHLNVAIELEPNRAEAHRLLGRVLLASGQDEAAVRELRLAVQLSPGHERAHLDLSDALVELRQYPNAERALRDTIQALPDSGRAHHKLGRLYQRQNQSLEALGELEAAAGLNPLIGLNRVLQTIGAINAAQQNFDAAIEAYSERVDVHPNDADAHEALGYTYSRVERNDEALAEFVVVLLLKPDRTNAYVSISQLLLRQGEYGAAAEAARQAVTRDPANKQARYALAMALMRLSKPDEAKLELDAFDRLQHDETAAFARGMKLSGLRREAAARSDNREYNAAVALLRTALELAPDVTSSHLELGVALLKSGQPAEAIDHLKAAERLQASFEVHQHLAAAYAALGREEDSQRELTTYRRLRRETLWRASAEQ